MKSPVFWSHAVASQFAASAAGREPPMTKPKKRGPAIPIVAGDPTSSSIRITSSGEVGSVGQRLDERLEIADRLRGRADPPLRHVLAGSARREPQQNPIIPAFHNRIPETQATYGWQSIDRLTLTRYGGLLYWR